jgi:uroporphyrinogen III methyltransferase/synthase
MTREACGDRAHPPAGKVWLVGAGPGDGGLLTLRGREVLDAADTVVHDRLVSEEILFSLPPGVRLIDAGKAPGKHPVPQEEINRLLIAEAREGRQVVRLKGGDPFLFGRGGEEALALAATGVPFGVIPGVSSALAVPAMAGIPVTHRGISASVHIFTWQGEGGRRPSPEFLADLVRAGGTLVILMGGTALEEIGEGLTGAGLAPDTPAALIRDGTTPWEETRLTTLEKLKEAARPCGAGGMSGTAPRTPVVPAPSPVLVLIGPVCSLAEKLRPGGKAGGPLVKGPSLEGLRIVVTRREGQNEDLCREIKARGGRAIPFPCIKTVPAGDAGGDQYRNASKFPWLVFTSPAGVDFFFSGYTAAGGDLRALSGCRIAAVGPSTAEALKGRGLIADYIPPRFNGRSLGEGLAERMGNREEALLIRSRRGAPGLPEALAAGAVSFREFPVYDTLPAEGGAYAKKIIGAGAFDMVLFASPSAVSAFADFFPALDFSALKALCTGETTAERARELGMAVHAAAEPGPEALCRLAAELGSRPSH